MELLIKLEILSSAAKYDVSCSSSGSSRKNIQGTVGDSKMSGICHSWTNDGRCVSLLKILLTNECIYNCTYCFNKVSNDIPRASFTPDEVADLTINFYRRNYIEGLFLSSAVHKNPDYTMECLLKTVKKLRENYRYNGYIHLKAIPGADQRIITEAGSYVDRMSVNIELPSEVSLKLLAPQKNKQAIIRPMGLISSKIISTQEEKRHFKSVPLFVPGGQSTQLIVGATSDNDLKIIKLSEGLYKKFSLKRVYYSAYVPVQKHPNLPDLSQPPLIREHRLYQADWLLRFYGFHADELLNENQPHFDLALDPKCNWALNNLYVFPLEINATPYETLLRIPGIGVRSAMKIVLARKVGFLNFDDLKKLGVVLSRARFFITCKGKYYSPVSLDSSSLRQHLLPKNSKFTINADNKDQLTIFSFLPQQEKRELLTSTITGEL